MSVRLFYLGSSVPKLFCYSGVRGNATSKATCAREEYFFNSMFDICNTKDGDQFYFVTTGLTRAYGYKPLTEINYKITKCIITATHHNLFLRKILQFSSILLTLSKTLTNKSVVVVYNSAPIYILVLTLLRFKNYKLVIQVEDFYNKNTLRYFIHKLAFSLSVRLSNLITISSIGQTVHLQNKNSSVNVIMNSGYILSLSNLTDPIISNNNQSVIFIYSGGLYKDRGVHDLLEAFCSIKLDNIRLIITGDGPLRKDVEFQQSVDSRVKYLGLLEDGAYTQLLNSCDVFLNPQNILISENFPSKVTAALSFGLKVISTKSIGILHSDFSDLLTFYDGSITELKNQIINASQNKVTLEEKNICRSNFLNLMSNQTLNLQSNLKRLCSFVG